MSSIRGEEDLFDELFDYPGDAGTPFLHQTNPCLVGRESQNPGIQQPHSRHKSTRFHSRVAPSEVGPPTRATDEAVVDGPPVPASCMGKDQAEQPTQEKGPRAKDKADQPSTNPALSTTRGSLLPMSLFKAAANATRKFFTSFLCGASALDGNTTSVIVTSPQSSIQASGSTPPSARTPPVEGSIYYIAADTTRMAIKRARARFAYVILEMKCILAAKASEEANGMKRED